MMTLMPVAAFADVDPADKGVASDNTSYVYTEDTNVDVDEKVKVELDLFDRYGNQDAETTVLYTWVTKKGSTTPVDSVAVNSLPKTASNVYKLTGDIDNSYTYNVTFYVAGTYVIHASVNEPTVNFKQFMTLTVFCVCIYAINYYRFGCSSYQNCCRFAFFVQNFIVILTY